MPTGDNVSICLASNVTIREVLDGGRERICSYVFRDAQPECLRVTSCHVVVRRFRSSNVVVSSAPLSEPSQRITGSEKELEIRAEKYDTSAPIPTIHEEDEQFEWREVIRGNCRRTLEISDPV